jgi:predicted RNase H-like nuclease (RuvC/YqgF family)
MRSSSNSFSILVPFASVNRKTKPSEAGSPQRPLSSIIAEN